MSTGADGDERFERGAAELLREGAADVDAATASRLNRARQRALAELGRPPLLSVWRRWQPAFVAGAAALALALLVVPRPTATPAASAEAAADLELMLAEDNLELIEELEFYEWLETGLDAEAPAPGVSG
jgi:hypothetical protein